jgi:hypothetical protein
MTHRTASHKVLAMACIAVLLSGCYGPFNLTQRLHRWNGQTGGRWTNELVFLVFVYVPVYGIAMLADGLVFNSVEFWTGDNPVDPPHAAGPATKTIAQGDQTVVLERQDVAGGRQMTIQVREGDAVVSQHSLEATLDGPTVVKNADGEVLGSAETLADGSLVLRNADGQEQQRYSARQIDRLAKKFSAASATP